MRYTYYREDYKSDGNLSPDHFIWKINVQTGDIYIYQWKKFDFLGVVSPTTKPVCRWVLVDPDDCRLKLYFDNEYSSGKFKKISEKEAFLEIL